MFKRVWNEYWIPWEEARIAIDLTIIPASFMWLVAGFAGWQPWAAGFFNLGSLGAMMVAGHLIASAALPFAMLWIDERNEWNQAETRRLELECELERLRHDGVVGDKNGDKE